MRSFLPYAHLQEWNSWSNQVPGVLCSSFTEWGSWRSQSVTFLICQKGSSYLAFGCSSGLICAMRDFSIFLFSLRFFKSVNSYPSMISSSTQSASHFTHLQKIISHICFLHFFCCKCAEATTIFKHYVNFPIESYSSW